MISETLGDPILGVLLMVVWIMVGMAGAYASAVMSYNIGTGFSLLLYSIGVLTGPLLITWIGSTWLLTKFHRGAWTQKAQDSVKLIAFMVSVFLISTPILIFW